MSFPTRIITSFLALLMTGCGTEQRAASAPLSAPWTDSVRLQETDSAFLASPSGLVVSADGRIFISDLAAGQVLAFDDAGSFLGRYGRRGRGPGELLAPSVLEIRGGDELLVLDNPTARVSRFDMGTRASKGTIRLLGPTMDLRSDGGAIWMQTTQAEPRTTLVSWDAAAESLRTAGQLPESYARFPRLLRSTALGSVALSGNEVWIGMQGANSIERYATAEPTVPTATVEIPRARRRGVPLDDAELMQREMSYEDEIASMSMLSALGILSDGRIATVHFDAAFVNDVLVAEAFLSVIDPRTGSGCIDLPLTTDESVVPVLRFVGDRLYLVEPKDTGGAANETWVRHLDVTALICERRASEGARRKTRDEAGFAL